MHPEPSARTYILDPRCDRARWFTQNRWQESLGSVDIIIDIKLLRDDRFDCVNQYYFFILINYLYKDISPTIS